MKYPILIKPNDSIYLVAPSFGCTFSPYSIRLEAAIKHFQKLDYKIIEGKNIRNYTLCASNTKEERAKEINDAFKSNATLVGSVGGGEIMCDILEGLDFDLFNKNPKWFIGFSDNTNLSFLLTTISDVASFYSVNFPTFGMTKPYKNITDTYDLLTGKTNIIEGYNVYEKPLYLDEDPLASYNLTETCDYKTIPESGIDVKGRMLGGCLDILVMLCGTEFDKTTEFIEKYQEDGIVWYLEACDLNTVSIYRALLQLKRAGWFKNAKAILFGRPLAAYQQNVIDMTQYNAAQMAIGYDIPMGFNLDFGHVPPNMPIINGAICEVNVTKDKFVMKYSMK